MSKGQALLLILLVVAVVLTIFLAIFSRSISDVSVSKQDEESYRAFSAAEAGVEKSLLTENLIFSPPSSSDLGGTAVTGSIIPALATSSYVYPLQIVSGDVANFWLVDHASDGSINSTHTASFKGRKIKICWGEDNTSTTVLTTPAIEVSVYYLTSINNYATAKVVRGAYDPYDGLDSGRIANGFTDITDTPVADCIIGGKSFEFYKVVDLNNDLSIDNGDYGTQGKLQSLRVRLIYNSDKSHLIGIDVSTSIDTSNTPLPPQGRTIVSSATTSTGSSTRKLQVFQPYSDLPPIFDAAIFSLPELVK